MSYKKKKGNTMVILDEADSATKEDIDIGLFEAYIKIYMGAIPKSFSGIRNYPPVNLSKVFEIENIEVLEDE